MNLLHSSVSKHKLPLQSYFAHPCCFGIDCRVSDFFTHSRRDDSVPLTSLSPPAATGCRPPVNCAYTSGALVTAWSRAPTHQHRGKQRVGILLRWLIVNRLDTRGYSSWTTFWRGECRCIECFSPSLTYIPVYGISLYLHLRVFIYQCHYQ